MISLAHHLQSWYGATFWWDHHCHEGNNNVTLFPSESFGRLGLYWDLHPGTMQPVTMSKLVKMQLFWELWGARLSWSTAVSVLKFAYVFACKKSKKCTKYYNCTIQINFMAYLKSVSKSGFFSVKLSYGVKNTAWEPSILYHLVFYGFLKR